MNLGQLSQTYDLYTTSQMFKDIYLIETKVQMRRLSILDTKSTKEVADILKKVLHDLYKLSEMLVFVPNFTLICKVEQVFEGQKQG